MLALLQLSVPTWRPCELLGWERQEGHSANGLDSGGEGAEISPRSVHSMATNDTQKYSYLSV